MSASRARTLNRARITSTLSSKRLFLAIAVLMVAVIGQRPGRAAADPPDALPFAVSYTVTGNYVVGGVDLAPGSASGGFATGTIPIGGVPANADIVAAFLYWETITNDDTQMHLADVRFRGQRLEVVQSSSQVLDATYAPCWSSGGSGPYKMTMHRADVRRLLPMALDADGQPTGKRLVNSADLTAAGFEQHTVKLPEAGTGNQTPQSGGASMLIVYRAASEPLTKVVIYDGVKIQAAGEATTQTIHGFFQSASSPHAKLTHITGSGANNSTDRVLFRHQNPTTLADITSVLATNAILGTASPSSDRAWSNPTFDVSALMPSRDPGLGFGEEVSTTVDHTKTSPSDCLAWAAIAFSTTVQDVDGDGLIDKLEDVSGLHEPDGEALPDLHAMHAGSDQRDLFLEVNAMVAGAGTSYGSLEAPFAGRIDSDPDNDVVTDHVGHNHLPTPAVIRQVGLTLASAPAVGGGVPGIRLHVDAGPNYHALGGAYALTDADEYLVPAADASGGELITETACVPDLGATPPRVCLFPAYPGTVGWKTGFQLYRDGRIGDPDEPDRRRFDHNRRDLFHYALYAHSGGVPRSDLACLDASGTPTAAVHSLTSVDPCGDLRDNPAFHVPSSQSGRGDLPGGDFVVSLGLWDTERFVGSEFVQASTTLHELGHNLERWHGGDPPTFGTVKVPGTTTPVSRLQITIPQNCKPNYLSVMSYLFQVNGLVDDAGVRHMDYSGGVITPAIIETVLSDGSLPVPLPYRTSWFARLDPGTLGVTLGAHPISKYCSGRKLPDPLPAGWVSYARIDAASRSEPIDWNADGTLASPPQDVNYDGLTDGASAPLSGANDWANLHLNQIGARRTMAGFSGGFLGGYVDGGYVDGGYVDGGYVDGGYVDGGYVDGGYVDGGYVDGGYVDGGYVDGGYVDGGYVDGGYVDGGRGFQDELTFELASELWGYAPPTELRACVIDGVDCLSPTASPNLGKVRIDWKLPHAGNPTGFYVYRVQGATVTPVSIPVPLPPTSSPGVPAVPGQAAYWLLDERVLTDGAHFTYYAKAEFPDDGDADSDPQLSIPSNYATITAHSEPPTVALTLGATPGPSGWFTASPVGVVVNATDNFQVASISCTDNGGAVVGGTLSGLHTGAASLSFSVSNEGTHAISCLAADGAGNTASAATTVRIDTVAPVTTITSTSASSIGFSATDATSGVAGYECKWDSGAFAACTSPASLASLSIGSPTFSVRARDVAGNIGSAVSYSFTTSYTVTPAPILIKSSAQTGSAVPITFQVTKPDGTVVTSTDIVAKIDSVFLGATCPAGSLSGTVELIYRNPNFSTGKSSLRYVSSSQSLQFNWDTTSVTTNPIITGKGCYIALVYLNDGAAPRPTSMILLK